MKLTPDQLHSIRNLCSAIVQHPKANPYAKTYADAIANGTVELEAKGVGITVEHALSMQFDYILSNLRINAKYPELKTYKQEIERWVRLINL